MLYYFVRLLRYLCRDFVLLSRPAKIDFLTPPSRLSTMASGSMAFTLVIAGAASLIHILGKTVQPAVK